LDVKEEYAAKIDSEQIEDRTLIFKVRELESSLNSAVKANDRMQEQIADLERKLSRSQDVRN